MAALTAPTGVHWSMPGEAILMTPAGGTGTISGPAIGAAIVSAIPYTGDFGAGASVVQGTIFVICVLLFREGIVGVAGRTLRKPLRYLGNFSIIGIVNRSLTAGHPPLESR